VVNVKLTGGVHAPYEAGGVGVVGAAFVDVAEVREAGEVEVGFDREIAGADGGKSDAEVVAAAVEERVGAALVDETGADLRVTEARDGAAGAAAISERGAAVGAENGSDRMTFANCGSLPMGNVRRARRQVGKMVVIS
jgi:hypothetical protein